MRRRWTLIDHDRCTSNIHESENSISFHPSTWPRKGLSFLSRRGTKEPFEGSVSISLSLSLSLFLSLSLSPSLFTKQHACFNDDSFFVAGAFYAFSLATPIELIDFIGCGVLLFDTKRQRACIIYRPCIGCLETNRDNCLSFTIQLSYIQILYILVTYNATRN